MGRPWWARSASARGERVMGGPRRPTAKVAEATSRKAGARFGMFGPARCRMVFGRLCRVAGDRQVFHDAVVSGLRGGAPGQWRA